MLPVQQLIECIICQNQIAQPGYNKCRRCGQNCEIITHDEINLTTQSPVLTIFDFKSKCCNDDIDIYSRCTCSPNCHEIYMQQLEEQFGKFKKVVDAATGISYQVPTRVIAEAGIKQQDLTKFPIWKDV